MIGAEKIYLTMDTKTFIMIYIIKTFHHYLLGNNFMFFVDHQTLIYLVNNPTISGQIA
jgi:hypothetical protein